ncbi:hypothetical protein SAMN05216228_102320 [Rhizobium tibeticum]|uniref:Uncharacterized protein n=1 Tax=Rhizobium tibeticum TaxID=501024 RepID=A0A1H8S2G8_9HYPH|nr:hypothetical protein RTCCBAU85039_4603 [Rhizobium tibeticum]SEO72726.1 hypothetical protein SAMN05216228_102320 [Rhizobium tibeticum]
MIYDAASSIGDVRYNHRFRAEITAHAVTGAQRQFHNSAYAILTIIRCINRDVLLKVETTIYRSHGTRLKRTSAP